MPPVAVADEAAEVFPALPPAALAAAVPPPPALPPLTQVVCFDVVLLVLPPFVTLLLIKRSGLWFAIPAPTAMPAPAPATKAVTGAAVWPP